MSDKIYKCLQDLRYSYEYKVPFEKVINSYGFYADPQYISMETFKNFAYFVYKTDIDNEGILKKLKKYPDYETFINSQGNFSKFFIERSPIVETPKKKQKKYMTYSAHGHFPTNNPISAFLNYLAILPLYLIMLIFSGVYEIFENFSVFSKNKKKK